MSFFSKIGSFFKKVFGNPNWAKTAQSTIAIVAPLAGTIVALADPADAELCQQVTHEVQVDLGTLSAVLPQFYPGATPDAGTLQLVHGTLGSIKDSLTPLLSEAHVKNPATVTKVGAVVNTIIGEVDAILALIPQPPPAAPPK